jgi:hypothetical protein
MGNRCALLKSLMETYTAALRTEEQRGTSAPSECNSFQIRPAGGEHLGMRFAALGEHGAKLTFGIDAENPECSLWCATVPAVVVEV